MSEKEEDERKECDNKMGFFGCTSYVIGNVVGSGIFITPSTVIRHVGSIGLSLIIWFACAVLSFIGGVVYIELGTGITEPGGDFAYCCFFGWRTLASTFMYVGILLGYPASVAIQAQTFGQYVMHGLSPLFTIDNTVELIIEKILGLSLIALIGFINFKSLGKFVSKAQIVLTILKLATMFFVILGGIYYLIQGRTENIENPFDKSDLALSSIALGFYASFFSYSGWDVLNYGVNEIRNPKRVLRSALLTGVSIIGFLYVLMVISYFTLINANEAKETEAIAALFSQRAFGKFSYAIPFLIAILLIGTLNSNLYVGTRYVHAAAIKGQLPSFLRYVHVTNKSPRQSVLLQMLFSAAYIFLNVDYLIEGVALLIILQKIVTLVGLLLMRYKRTPVNPNVIRSPIICTIIFLIVSIALVIIPIMNYRNILVNAVFLAIGLLIHLSFVKYRIFPECFNKFDDLLARFFARLLDSKLDEKPTNFNLCEQNDAVNTVSGNC